MVKNLMLSAAVLVLLCSVGEVVYRLHGSEKRRVFLAGRDPDSLVTRAAAAPAYYELEPNSPGFTNDAGFRDLARSPTKPPGVYRIAVIGDSVTMQGALAFEDLYVTRLQRRLDGAFPGRVEVLNHGITGYNAEQEAALLERAALGYDPDLVVWQFHDNDGAHSTSNATLGWYHYQPSSYFAHHVSSKLTDFWCKVRTSGVADGALTPDQRNLVCRWDAVVSSFERIATRLRRLGVGLVVLLYPTWPEGDDWRNYGKAGVDLHRRLTAHLESLGATVVDLLPVFERLDPARYRVEPTDPWHPNAEGHEVIARTAFPRLAEIVRSSMAPAG